MVWTSKMFYVTAMLNSTTCLVMDKLSRFHIFASYIPSFITVCNLLLHTHKILSHDEVVKWHSGNSTLAVANERHSICYWILLKLVCKPHFNCPKITPTLYNMNLFRGEIQSNSCSNFVQTSILFFVRG